MHSFLTCGAQPLELLGIATSFSQASNLSPTALLARGHVGCWAAWFKSFCILHLMLMMGTMVVLEMLIWVYDFFSLVVVPVSPWFVDVRTSEGVERRQMSVEIDQDSVVRAGVFLFSKNCHTGSAYSLSSSEGPQRRPALVRMLPFTPCSIHPNSSSPCIGTDAAQSYLSVGCSKWRPHFPALITGKCDVWLTGCADWQESSHTPRYSGMFSPFLAARLRLRLVGL